MTQVDDLMEKYKLADKKRAETTWFIRIPLNIADFIWYRILLRIEDLPRETKFLYQRITKGYSDNDVWNLSFFTLNKVYKPLKDFVRNYEERGMSLPMDFQTDPGAWTLVLKKIEYSFDDMWRAEFDDDYDMYKMSEEGLKEHNDKVQEGFELYGKYFRDLWD